MRLGWYHPPVSYFFLFSPVGPAMLWHWYLCCFVGDLAIICRVLCRPHVISHLRVSQCAGVEHVTSVGSSAAWGQQSALSCMKGVILGSMAPTMVGMLLDTPRVCQHRTLQVIGLPSHAGTPTPTPSPIVQHKTCSRRRKPGAATAAHIYTSVPSCRQPCICSSCCGTSTRAAVICIRQWRRCRAAQALEMQVLQQPVRLLVQRVIRRCSRRCRSALQLLCSTCTEEILRLEATATGGLVRRPAHGSQ